MQRDLRIHMKEKVPRANNEALDELHCEHSYETIRQKKGSQSEVSEGEAFKIGSKSKPIGSKLGRGGWRGSRLHKPVSRRANHFTQEA